MDMKKTPKKIKLQQKKIKTPDHTFLPVLHRVLATMSLCRGWMDPGCSSWIICFCYFILITYGSRCRLGLSREQGVGATSSWLLCSYSDSGATCLDTSRAESESWSAPAVPSHLGQIRLLPSSPWSFLILPSVMSLWTFGVSVSLWTYGL